MIRRRGGGRFRRTSEEVNECGVVRTGVFWVNADRGKQLKWRSIPRHGVGCARAGWASCVYTYLFSMKLGIKVQYLSLHSHVTI